MDLISILFIAIGLSMDSFAVSISNGLTIKDLKFKSAVYIAASFAFFQSLMPLLGWYSGIGIEKYIVEFDHWIAFILLAFIGTKMIYEGFTKEETDQVNQIKKTTLIGQSIATSIDAFAVGISFAFLKLSIIKPVLIIGIVTFLFSMIGLRLGKSLGQNFGKSVEIFGGIILIGIGVKIVIEHIF